MEKKELSNEFNADEYKDIPLQSIQRAIGSPQFIIPTPKIMELKTAVKEWIDMNHCGGIVYGRSRIGKTSAIQYISARLKEEYGQALPVHCLYMTANEVATMKNFYVAILQMLGHEIIPSRGTTREMRQRIINTLVASSISTKYRRVVIFIDEANLLSITQIAWLSDFYNELYQRDIIMTVIMFGTPERVGRTMKFECMSLSFIQTYVQIISFIQRIVQNFYYKFNLLCKYFSCYFVERSM